MLLNQTTARLQHRHNLRVLGDGPDTLLFVHGLGCDQAMWRFVAPHFEGRGRVVLMDLMGFGGSQQSEWTEAQYDGLDGHARDVAAVAEVFGNGRCIVVGHSVSAMIGLLADAHAPGAIIAHAMVAPSPCYLNDGAYPGGFEQAVLDQTLALIEADAQAWTQAMMPLLLAPDASDPLSRELTSAFCRARPQALANLARATFLGDLRDRLAGLHKPVLVLQCDEDMVAPLGVGEFMAATLPDATLRVIRNPGHCPHLTRPQACIEALEDFLDALEHAQEVPGLHIAATRPGWLARIAARLGDRTGALAGTRRPRADGAGDRG